MTQRGLKQEMRAVHVGGENLPRIATGQRRGAVDHMRHSAHRRLHRNGITDIRLHCFDGTAFGVVNWCDIDRAHGGAACNQVATKVNAEKPGTARNQK